MILFIAMVSKVNCDYKKTFYPLKYVLLKVIINFLIFRECSRKLKKN
uniref:Uncharacterized protein n=1 Tax=Heterorhabditis bacteriophora TaxID=37862 RepID=A0A1I7WL56_HETBA